MVFSRDVVFELSGLCPIHMSGGEIFTLREFRVKRERVRVTGSDG